MWGNDSYNSMWVCAERYAVKTMYVLYVCRFTCVVGVGWWVRLEVCGRFHGFMGSYTWRKRSKAREEQGSQCVNNMVGENGFMNSIVWEVLNGA